MPTVEIIKTGWFVDCEAKEQAHYVELRFPSGKTFQATIDEDTFTRILDELGAEGDAAAGVPEANPSPPASDDLTSDPEPDMGSGDEDGIPPSE